MKLLAHPYKILLSTAIAALTCFTGYGQNIKTVAGTGVNDCTGDGGPAISAATGGISGITTDAAGNMVSSAVLPAVPLFRPAIPAMADLH